MLQRYIVTVEGPNLSDMEEAELLALPHAGDPIETRYGTCVVTATEVVTDGGVYAGKIFCRLP